MQLPEDFLAFNFEFLILIYFNKKLIMPALRDSDVTVT